MSPTPAESADPESADPESAARRFVAVRPPPEVLGRLAELDRPEESGVRWVPAEQWHVTLRFLGRVERGPVVEALRGLSSPELGPVEATMGPLVSRLGRDVVCVPVTGLDGLAAAVVGLTAGLGEPPDPRPFAGHVTLARLRRRAACGLTGAPFAATFEVHEVELVRSELTHLGARHTTELVVPLRPPDRLG